MAEALTLKDLITLENAAERIKELPFESGLKLLEELVTKVESGALSLDKSILSYEKGVELINHLKKLLSGAEEKLKVLNRENGKGA